MGPLSPVNRKSNNILRMGMDISRRERFKEIKQLKYFCGKEEEAQSEATLLAKMHIPLDMIDSGNSSDFLLNFFFY